jgi:hypothetical protein
VPVSCEFKGGVVPAAGDLLKFKPGARPRGGDFLAAHGDGKARALAFIRGIIMDRRAFLKTVAALRKLGCPISEQIFVLRMRKASVTQFGLWPMAISLRLIQMNDVQDLK